MKRPAVASREGLEEFLILFVHWGSVGSAPHQFVGPTFSLLQCP